MNAGIVAKLAIEAGSALVDAMATDSWQAVRSGFARLFGRLVHPRHDAIMARMDDNAAALEGTGQGERDQSRRDLAVEWRGLLADLMADHPEILDEMRTLLTQVRALPPANEVWSQRNVARGHATQYVVGGGSLHVDQREFRADRDQIFLQTGAFAAVNQPGMVSVEPLFGRLPRTVRGRGELVETLVDLIGERSGQRVRVLHGPGGCGKSTVALEVARRARDEGVLTWRVDASGPTQLSAGMREVAASLGADPAQIQAAWSGISSAPDLVWRLLTGARSPWLLLIDQADEPELLSAQHARVADGTGWLRDPGAQCGGVVLVTSRDGSVDAWGSWPVLHQLGMLDVADAADVLMDLAGHEAGSVEQAGALAAKLGCLPLALTLVGNELKATLSEPFWPGEQAIRSFAAYRAALTEHQAGDGSGDAVAQQRIMTMISEVVASSLDQVDNRSVGLARPLLWLLACFAEAPIPVAVLDPSVLATTAPFRGADQNAMRRALTGLTDRHLAEMTRLPEVGDNHPEFVVSLHPLIRDVCLDHLSITAQLSVYLGVLVAVMENAVTEVAEQGADGSRFDPFAPRTYARWRRMIAHGTAALRLCEPAGVDRATAVRALRLTIFGARHINASGAYAQAESILRSCGRVSAAILGPDDPITIEARHQRAWSLRQQGRLDEAEAEYRGVGEARRRVLGEDHPGTLMARHKLAGCWTAAGRLDDADVEYRIVHAARRRVLGDDHPDTLRTWHARAWLLDRRGELEAAAVEFRAVYEARRRVIGEDHPDTLRTRHNLARTLELQGRTRDAEREYRQAHEAYRRVLGPDNPRTLDTEYNVARVLAAQGRLDEAEMVYREVYEARRRVLGENHADTAAVRSDLAALTSGR